MKPALVNLAALTVFLISTLSISMETPAQARVATIFLYSDPRPGLSESEGETALTDDFNQAVEQIPAGWTLDCVQNIGDIDPISTGQPPLYYTLDNAYAASQLAYLPHFMCVGNHEAETPQDMMDIRAKFSEYPDWNLVPGPDYTSETTYSYDAGDIHVVVINEYWDGAFDDAWFMYSSSNGGYITDELFEWIKDDLRSSDKPYKIVVGHEPGYPVGRHVGDSLDQDPDNRDKFFNLLRTEGVIAYFTAHTHRYNLTEHRGVFEVNTGVCGAYVGQGKNDAFSTLGYAHCDSDGFKIRMVREDPSLGWDSPRITTVTRPDLTTQVFVNTAAGAGTVCRYFVDYTSVAQPSNPDWSAYGAWWENTFDDIGAGWSDGELAVGYDSTNPGQWGWINKKIDPDPTGSGDEQVYGVFVRIPFTVYDMNAYRFMKLGVDYDDAVIVWLNGTKIYESPTSPTMSLTDYWDKVATGNHPANGDESLNPDFDTIDVSAFSYSLKEGSNLLVIGNWNRAPGSSNLVAGARLYQVRTPKTEPLCECQLVADAAVVKRQSSLGLQATVVNSGDKAQAFYFGTNITGPYGRKYPSSGYLLGPWQVALGPHESRSIHRSYMVASSVPVGTYTYHGYVGRPGTDIYDECLFDFQVIDPSDGTEDSPGNGDGTAEVDTADDDTSGGGCFISTAANYLR